MIPDGLRTRWLGRPKRRRSAADLQLLQQAGACVAEAAAAVADAAGLHLGRHGCRGRGLRAGRALAGGAATGSGTAAACIVCRIHMRLLCRRGRAAGLQQRQQLSACHGCLFGSGRGARAAARAARWLGAALPLRGRRPLMLRWRLPLLRGWLVVLLLLRWRLPLLRERRPTLQRRLHAVAARGIRAGRERSRAGRESVPGHCRRHPVPPGRRRVAKLLARPRLRREVLRATRHLREAMLRELLLWVAWQSLWAGKVLLQRGHPRLRERRAGPVATLGRRRGRRARRVAAGQLHLRQIRPQPAAAATPTLGRLLLRPQLRLLLLQRRLQGRAGTRGLTRCAAGSGGGCSTAGAAAPLQHLQKAGARGRLPGRLLLRQLHFWRTLHLCRAGSSRIAACSR